MNRARPLITRGTLRRDARLCPDGLRRLARALRLRTDGMSPQQFAGLVWWRLSRRGG